MPQLTIQRQLEIDAGRQRGEATGHMGPSTARPRISRETAAEILALSNGDPNCLRDYIVEQGTKFKPRSDSQIQAEQEQEIMIQQAAGTALAVAEDQNKGGELAFYNRIANPMDAAEQMGHWLHRSAMMGIGTKEAGIMVALTCLTERISPMEFSRRYHIIEGKPSMKADYMLARFQELGGKMKLINRNAFGTEIELEWNGSSAKFSLTWEEAQLEPFTKGKGGKIKDNYATPRARMQMLYARCVSDGIRAICPQVNCGTYTPEETMDLLGKDGDVVEAEFTRSPAAQTTQAETVSAPAATPSAPSAASPVSSQPTGRELLRENGGISAINGELLARESAAASPQTGQSSGGGEVIDAEFTVAKISESQLQDLARLKQALGLTKEQWVSLLANPKLGSVATAKDLTVENADRLRKYLRKQVDALPVTPETLNVQAQDDLSRWADGALMPGGSAAAKKN